MPLPSAGAAVVRRGPSKDLRPLDDTDRALLRALVEDARVSNKELAAKVGIAQSTCLARVRALRETGVIRGYHADVDPEALGHDLQAMIAIRLQPHARGAMAQFTANLSRRPEVLEVYFVAGATTSSSTWRRRAPMRCGASWARRSTATRPSRAPRPT